VPFSLKEWEAMNRSSVDWDNPYRVPEVMFEPTVDKPRARPGYFWVKLFLLLQLLTIMVSLGFAGYEVETIVGSGPVLSIVGLFLAVASAKKQLWFSFWWGISAPVFCAAVFLTIFLQSWSPSDARIPVPIMGGMYLLVSGMIFVWIFRTIRTRERLFDMDQPRGPDAMSATF
jgi:hypothetical protein